jgi:hypothetical protein
VLREVQQIHIVPDADFMTTRFSRLLQTGFGFGRRGILRQQLTVRFE